MKLDRLTFGSFLDHNTWLEAKRLIDFQVDAKLKNKHYNKLSFYNFEAAKKCQDNIKEEAYFNERIRTNFFYALQNEYYSIPYAIPKRGLGIRNYYFFSYPMITLYYAVTLYIAKLTEQFIHSKTSDNISSYFGGKISFREKSLVITKESTYYRYNFEIFKYQVNKFIQLEDNRFILKLDIQDYFEAICVPTLLELIDKSIKHSVRQEFNFDEHTKEQLEFFFRFIKHGKGGIPQSESNLASGYLGFLYLFFGDFIIEDCIKSSAYYSSIEQYKILRYVDDTYIVIDFSSSLSHNQEEAAIHHLLAHISHCLYEKLKLNINSKTKIYRPRNADQLLELTHALGNVSEESETEVPTENTNPVKVSSHESSLPNLTVVDKTERLFHFLSSIKSQHLNYQPDDYASITFDDLKNIFDHNVQTFLKKKENAAKMSFLLADFNYELCRLQPHAFICLLLMYDTSAKGLLEHLKSLEAKTIYDVNLLMTYLCQVDFKEKAIKKLLRKNESMKLIFKRIKDNKPGSTPCTGYYKLPYDKISWIMNYTTLLEQIKRRIYSERLYNYSVSLNLLLNELQLICWLKEGTTNDLKHYDATSVVQYLDSQGISNEARVAVTNLFDRRNNNGISHPGSVYHIPVAVSRKEYELHRSGVFSALKQLLHPN